MHNVARKSCDLNQPESLGYWERRLQARRVQEAGVQHRCRSVGVRGAWRLALVQEEALVQVNRVAALLGRQKPISQVPEE